MIRRIAAVLVALTMHAALAGAQDTAQATALTVTVTSAEVFKGPSNVTPVIGHVPRNTVLPIVRNLGSWVKVSWPAAPDHIGYVNVSMGLIGPLKAKSATSAPSTASAKPAAATPSAAKTTTAAKPASATAPASKPVAAKPAAATASAAKPTTATASAAKPASAKPAASTSASGSASAKPASSNGTTSTAAAQVPLTQAPSVPPVARTPVSDQPAPRVQGTVVPASHELGVGALVGYTSSFGATTRVWRGKHIGIQGSVSRSTLTSDTSADSVTSTQFEPAFIYGIVDRISDYVWLRPYVGSGVAFRYQSLASGAEPSTNTVGVRFFGGAEFTFASAPRFGLSADAGYRRFQESFAGFEPSRFSVSIAGHWYIR